MAMYMENLIATNDFCTNHHIEISFINSLQETGLIEITTILDKDYLHVSQLTQLEKFVRLHYDLEINPEGIDSISHLLEQIIDMQNELIALKNRLRFYEAGL
jgi:hypothetical protein